MFTQTPKRGLRLHALVALGLLSFVACGDDGPFTPETKPAIQITPSSSSVSIERGEQATLQITVSRTDFTGPVSISAAGVPADLLIQDLVVPASATTGELLIDATTAAVTTAQLSLTGSGAGVADHTVPLTLIVTPALPRIILTITTSGEDRDPDGYGVLIDGGAPVTVSTNGETTIKGLTVGVHTIELNDVADNCYVERLNRRTFELFDGSRLQLSYDVTCYGPIASGQFLYVPNLYSSTMSVVNVENGTVVGTVDTDILPSDVVVSPNGRSAYVKTVLGVHVVRAERYEVTQTLYDAVPNESAIAVSPDGSRLYITGDGEMAVVETESYQKIGSIALSPMGNPHVLISPDGRWAYVASLANPATNDPSGLAIVDLEELAIAGFIPLDEDPFRLDLTPDGRFAYVSRWNNVLDPGMWVIDLEARAVVHVLAGLTEIDQFIVSVDGSRLYAAQQSSGSLFEFDLGTETITRTISNIPRPNAIAASPGGTYLFVGTRGAENNTVWLVETAPFATAGAAEVGFGPGFLAITP